MSSRGNDSDEPPVKKQKIDDENVVSDLASISASAPVGPQGQQLIEAGDKSVQAKGAVLQRPVAVVTSGNIRPTLLLHTSQSVDAQKPNLLYTTDGKVVLQVPQSTSAAIIRSKSPINIPVSPRLPSPQVITLPSRTQPMTVSARPVIVPTKPITKVTNTSVEQKSGAPVQRFILAGTPPSSEHPVQISPGQTQISFQVPVNWNGSGKSLLDSSKVSLVNISQADGSGRSLLQGSAIDGSGLQHVASVGVKTSSYAQGNIPRVTAVPQVQQAKSGASVPKIILQPGSGGSVIKSSPISIPTTNAPAKAYITGNKLFGNLGSGQVISQSPSGVIMVTRPGLASPTSKPLPKVHGSLVINNKPHTIMQGGSNPSAVQIMGKDGKGKMAMNEAQIMLPSGPKKIAVHYQVGTTITTTEGKQIIVKSPYPVSQGKTIIQKTMSSPQMTFTDFKTSSVTSISAPITAKVVDASPSKSVMKTTVLASQKNWELVKQSSQLMSQSNNGSTFNQYTNIKASDIKTPEKPKAVSEASVTENVDRERKLSEEIDHLGSKTSDNSTEAVKANCGSPDRVKHDGNVEERMEVDDVDGAKGVGDIGNSSQENRSEEVETTAQGVDNGAENYTNYPDAAQDDSVVDLDELKATGGGGQEEINDGLECNETLNTSDELEPMDTHGVGKLGGTGGHQSESQQEVTNKDEISQCENCSEYGFTTDFLKDGRFCSQTCVSAFDGRHQRDAKKQGTISKVIMGMKKGGRKKQLLLKEREERNNGAQGEKQEDHNNYGKKSWTKSFVWARYLAEEHAVEAPARFFKNPFPTSVTPNLFRVGSKLEAVDKKNSSLICVASVADTMGDKVLIHFDSWEDNYDYWCDTSSPLIHPVGYCEENELVLSPPQDWPDISDFTWPKFLAKTKSQAVPARAFKPRPAIAFEPGMKVEVVDKRNPLLVRVATIAEVENNMVKIHFDGWLDVYDYWLEEDSPDIHPPGWCAKTNHPLMPPISNTFGCPYSEINMNKELVMGDRLGPPSKDEQRFLDRADSPEPGWLRSPSCHQKARRWAGAGNQKDTFRQGIHNSVFASSLISPPKPDVPLCWEQHCKLLPGVTNIRGNDVNKWSTEQVAAYINTLPGCEEQAKLFKEEYSCIIDRTSFETNGDDMDTLQNILI
ncbi:LMBL3-like protein [Mya arenaria]|uniref:LMBL3-like protein n=1 Tax=Mya arenaria TaxID=6604 RepID=A0ABY7FN64_MYAAR|nr:LMBL3-like protein [Mya arenaria]